MGDFLRQAHISRQRDRIGEMEIPAAPVRAALAASEGVNPDDAARNRALAGRLGLSESLVGAAPLEAENEALARTLETNPGAADWAGRNVGNAAYARKLKDVLPGLFDGFGRLRDYQAELEADYSFIEKMAVSGQKGISIVAAAIPSIELMIAENKISAMERGNQMFTLPGPARLAQKRQALKKEDPTQTEYYSALKDKAATIKRRLDEEVYAPDVPPLRADGALGNYALDFMEGAPQVIGAILAGSTTGGVGSMSFLGTQIAGGKYYKLRQEGVDPDRAAKASFMDAGLQAPLEYLPISRLFKLWKAKGKTEILKRFGEALVTDVATETVQGIPDYLTEQWAKEEEATEEGLAAALGQGFYEGLTMAPFSVFGGLGAAVRTYREEKRAGNWVARQRQFFEQKQALLADNGGDAAALEELLAASSDELGQNAYLPFSGLEEAARSGVDLVTPFGLEEELQKANPDRVFSIPVAQLHTRLDQAQFDMAMQVMRRDWRADSLVEAGLKSRRGLTDVVQSARIENAVVEGGLSKVATDEMRAAAVAAVDAKSGAAQAMEGTAGPKDGETAEAPESGRKKPLGPAYIPARTAADFFQSAVLDMAEGELDGGAALQTSTLESIGISADAFEAAVQNGEDLELDLDAVIANWDYDPAILKEMIAQMTLEDSASIAEREELLAEFGPPERVRTAGQEVSGETRAGMIKRLKKAGRTDAQARRETELYARMASTLGRIIGLDPNTLIERTLFSRMDQAGAELHQAAFQITPDGNVIVAGEAAPKVAQVVEISSALPVDWKDTKALASWLRERYQGKTVTIKDDGTIQEFTGRGLESSAKRRGKEQRKMYPGLEELVRNAVYDAFEAADARHEGKVSGQNVYYSAARIGDRYFSVRLKIDVPLSQGSNPSYKDHRIAAIEIAPSLYRSPAGGLATQTDSAIRSISVAILKGDVNPSRIENGVLFQSAPAGPRGGMTMPTLEALLSDPQAAINVMFGQSADASTAVHEFAHIMRNLISESMALPADRIADHAAFDSLKEDWAGVENWLSKLNDDAALEKEYYSFLESRPEYEGRDFKDFTADEKERMREIAKHEYFARGFELYLMEGQAPARGLRRIFAAMKKALIDLYNTALRLDVELDDDARRFFDSILAADEEMVAESLRGVSGLTVGEMDAIVGDKALAKDLEEMNRARDRAREEREAHITKLRVKEKARLLRQWRKDGLAAAQEDARIQLVRNIVKGGGIHPDALKAAGYEGEGTQALIRRYPGLVDGNSRNSLDGWAMDLGFDGADALHQQLVGTPTLKQLQDEYVKQQEAEWEEYFDLDVGLTDAEIAADELERKLYAKYSGEKYRPGSDQALAAAIKAQLDHAGIDELRRLNQKEWRQKLDNLRRELARAEKSEQKTALKEFDRGTKAGYDLGVADATLAGRMAEAQHLGRMKEKERARQKLELMEQRLDLSLRFKEQAQRVREIVKFEKKAQRLFKQKPADAHRQGGILPEFQAQIQGILKAAGFGGRVMPSENNLAAFVHAQAQDGVDLGIAPEIVSGTIWNRKDKDGFPIPDTSRTYRALDYAEFKNLKNAVDVLLNAGRRGQQVRYDGNLIDLKTAVNKAVQVIHENNVVHAPRTPEEIYAERHGLKKSDRINRWLKGQDAGFMPSARKMQHLMYELDGQQLNSFLQKLMYQPANHAHNTSLRLTTLWMNELQKIAADSVGQTAFAGWQSQRFTIPELGNQEVPKSTIIAAALNWGNIQNQTALLNNPAYGNPGKHGNQFPAMFKHLTRADWTFVQSVWDFLDNQVYPELNALTKRTKGIPLEKVEAAPFTVTLADGSTMDLRGGYYPLMFDRELSASRVIDRKTRQEAIENTESLFGPTEVRASATHARTGRSYKELTPELNLGLLISSLMDNVQDLAFREAVADTWRVLRQPEIKAAMDGVFGEEAWKQARIWIRNLTRGGSENGDSRNALARMFRGNTSMDSMGLKMSVMAVQFTGISQSAHKLGWGSTLDGIRSVYLSGDIKSSFDFMYEKSSQLKSRNEKGPDRDMFDAITKGKPPLFKDWFMRWKEFLFKWIGLMDQLVANAVWMGTYRKALHEGKSDADAVMDADAIISMTQSMGDNKDMSYAQQGWSFGDYGKLATMFGTFFSSTQNLIWLANRQARREKRRGSVGKAALEPLKAFFNLSLIPAILSQIMWNGGLDWPDDEEEAVVRLSDLCRDIIGNMTGGLPVVRDVVGSLADYYLGTGLPRFAVTPAQGVITGIPKFSKSLGNIVSGEGELKDAGRMAQSLGHLVPSLPGSQISTTLEGIQNWDEYDSNFDKIYRLFIRDPEGYKK